MVKAEWCGYCKKAKPEFEKAQSFFGGASAFGYVDYEKNPRLCEKLKANSFPTIKMVKDGKISPKKYEGERTKAAFIDEVVSSNVL
jgi:thiol-disulfide isomerase/thioredoxin